MSCICPCSRSSRILHSIAGQGLLVEEGKVRIDLPVLGEVTVQHSLFEARPARADLWARRQTEAAHHGVADPFGQEGNPLDVWSEGPDPFPKVLEPDEALILHVRVVATNVRLAEVEQVGQA
jgi:hypothetical protein